MGRDGQRPRSMPVVGLVHPLQFDDVRALLEKSAEVRMASSVDEPGIASLVAESDGLIIRGPERLTAAMLGASPHLRAVAVTGSGTNHVDVAAATDLGVPVACGAGVSPDAVAEYVIGAMIAGRRRFLSLHHGLTTGALNWAARLPDGVTHQVMGARLGLVGLGHIGGTVARIARNGLDMTVRAFDPLLSSAPEGVSLVEDLGELFTWADLISVNAPLTKATRGLVGRNELRLLGPDGVLVNASRGGIVDEAALLAALRSGEIGGAVVDVFEAEPPSPDRRDELRNTPNLLCTPHVAGVTYETRHRLEQNAVEQLLVALDGRRPTTLANPEVAFPPPSAETPDDVGR